MQQKSCSGTQTLTNWGLVNPSCNYDVTLIIDGVAITTAVTINSGMTTTAIAALFNANRIGNTTGTISCQISGNDLLIIITGIVLSPSAAGHYLLTALGPGFPCGDFTLQTAILTCTLLPPTGKAKGYGSRGLVCFARKFDAFGNMIECPKYITYKGFTYTRISEDPMQCCYRRGKF